MSYKYKHAISVMRCQPFHKGHEYIIRTMLAQAENVTVLLGSIQEHGTDKNPFNFTTRKKMIQNVFKHDERYPNLRIIGIQDIYNDAQWAKYVLDFVNDTSSFADAPDAYFCGTEYDGHWYEGLLDVNIMHRNNLKNVFVSGSMLRDMFKYDDIRWQALIDESNHSIIENYLAKKKSPGIA